MDAHCENQVALTHRCSSHPSCSQERSSGPSLVSTRNPLVQWAATCELLGNSGAAPSSGHRVWRHRFRLPSGGCSYLTWWFGCALWVSVWLVPVLRASVGAVGAAVRGRARPQEWPTELLQFRLTLGCADRPICGVVHMCGDQGLRQGGNRSRAGRRGGRGSGRQPMVGLCWAA